MRRAGVVQRERQDERMPDPLCVNTVANPFGGLNSLLKVPPPETGKGSDR